MATDKKLYKYEVPLDGKLITWDDPSKIGANFQALTNLRYTKTHPKGVGGMTKITSNKINSTYYKVRSGIHYTKNQPSESHVLIEAFNTAEDASRILQNTTAIPNAGNFSGTSLYTPSGSIAGRWALAPDGDVAYCNGEEVCLWGGNEREIAGFINYDPDSSLSYDYTQQVRNTLTDAKNKAVLHSTSAGIDSNVMLLLHLDNNVTDSSPTPAHTITNTNVTFTGTGAVFGTHRAVFTTNAKLTVPDNADFDFSGGTFTIDLHCELDDLDSDYSIYYQNTTNDDDSFNVMVDTNGAVLVRIKDTGIKQFTGAVDFTTANGVIAAGTDYHIEIVEIEDSWGIFVDGILKAYLYDAARGANYTGLVQIGYDTTTYLEGKIDEYRVSDSARHTTNFEIPTEAYSTNTTKVYLYIGSLRPLDGIKFYIGTANTSTSSMTLFYWNGSIWVSVSSLSDGTAVSGKSLAQTESVTFTSTASNAKIKYIDGVMIYWYKMVISAVSANTSIYYSTVSAPFQPIKDTWDGMPNLIDFFQIYNNKVYKEYTLNVRENYYHSSDTGSYAELDSLSATTDYFVCGFYERMVGMVFNFVSGKGNTNNSTILKVSYWNGATWTDVGNLNDGTFEDNKTLAKTGAVTWNVIDIENEFTTSINNDIQLYYYKFDFSKQLSGDVQIYHITGIRTQKDIGAYNFPLLSNDRLFLCNNNKERKNEVLCTASETSSALNGDDSAIYAFGDQSELIGGAWIYSQYGSNLYNVTIFFKKNETWALVGNSPEDWIKYKVSDIVGCVAPETIRVVDLGIETKMSNRNVVIWQGANGLYLTDGRSPILISEDIKDKFDKRLSTSINTSEITNSISFWDSDNKCYHWKWASGTSTVLNEEWVFDFNKMAWFEIDRTSTKDLQFGIKVKDTSGNTYNYGFIDTGYMERLEYGNSFDGQDIVHTLQFGDIALAEESIAVETTVHYSCLMVVAKTTTSSSITIVHCGDGKTTGESWTELPQKSGHRITYPVEHQSLGSYIFHSFKFTITTDDESIGFEPLYFYTLYEITRDHTRDYR
ncbi:hypothetical protein KAX02_03020 [candidate division WOR-3 bacterium]|nr:hypothetical protein [candidate division WOR-3 bacterium]